MAARNALRESDARFEALADALPHMVWSTLPDGYHDYFNSQWHEFTGLPVGATDGDAWNDLLHPDDRERAWAIWRKSLETGEPYEIEYRLRHRTGNYRWALGRAMPIRGADGTIIRWIGTCTDINESKRHAEQVEVLSRELSHRIKNIFAVIASLVSLSARQKPEHKPFAYELKQRIAALGRAHEFVRPHSDTSRKAGVTVTLHTLLAEILSPYPAYHENRLSISGDDVDVDDRSATPLALLVHELATNATKYGALSNADGRVSFTTRVEGDELLLSWIEVDGPRLDGPPDGTGFGTALTQLSIADQLGGQIERVWDPAGLRVSARVPSRSLRRQTA